MSSSTETSSSPVRWADPRLDPILMAINPAKGKWPFRSEDWDAARRLQEEGLNLSCTQGFKPKVTLFHRLTKQLFKAQDLLLTDKELLAPFWHLSEITNGKALHSDHHEAWERLNQSYSIMTNPRERNFHIGILELFIAHAKPPFANNGNFSGMLHRASSLDLPEEMEWLSVNSPHPLNKWRFLEAIGSKAFDYMLSTEPDLRELAPGTQSSLHDRMLECSYMRIGKIYQDWLESENRFNAMDQALPNNDDETLPPSPTRRPRF